MIKALIYKEWIKTRWGIMGIAAIGLALEVYLFLRLGRSFRIAGSEHLWDVIVNREQFMFPDLKYFPILAGIVIGLLQFIPELTQKRLKLTLHLPMPENKITATMAAYGLGTLLLIFSLHLAVFFIGIGPKFPSEIIQSMWLTLLPWYTAGLVAYFACMFVCTEPTWWLRIVNALVSIAVCKLFFMSDLPASYSKILWMLPIPIVLFALFSFLSVYRFKIGKQD
jgi:hypothetical protein